MAITNTQLIGGRVTAWPATLFVLLPWWAIIPIDFLETHTPPCINAQIHSRAPTSMHPHPHTDTHRHTHILNKTILNFLSTIFIIIIILLPTNNSNKQKNNNAHDNDDEHNNNTSNDIERCCLDSRQSISNFLYKLSESTIICETERQH